jgi:23S rRNA pseudouridine2605 synthase
MTTRLNKYIAHTAGLSRRDADSAIEQGRVLVNDKVAEIGLQVAPDDIVMLDGKHLSAGSHTYTYLMLNKPIGYVSSRREQGDTPTIYSLLPENQHHLKPVGRLDKDSSGLIILTDDGDFAHQMTHPKFYKTKVYEISLDKPLAPLHQQMINDYGVHLEDGPSKLQLQKRDDTATQWQVTMHEGRNRQIRRTFASLGYTVVALHRTQFGTYNLNDLAPGKTSVIKA